MLSFFSQLKRFCRDKAYRRSRGYRVRNVTPSARAIPDLYLTTATIVHDEAKYIREFVAFHKVVGVDHMLIYMDGGFDLATASALDDFVTSGFVELIAWPRLDRGKNNQFLAYKNAVERMCRKTKWLAMIDADEFLFASASHDLRKELQQREKYSAVSVYSHTFGTGGVARIPHGGLVTEALKFRSDAEHVKNKTQRTIVQPQAVAAIRSANTVVLRGTASLGWDENGKSVLATGEAGHGSQHLRIHHYYTRAEEDFAKKLARQYFGKSNHAAKMAGKDMEAADGSLSVVEDLSLHRYLPELKKMLKEPSKSASN